MCVFGIMDKPKRVDHFNKFIDDDVDHEWLAATSSVPDVDMPPEVVSGEVVENVLPERESVLNDVYIHVAAEDNDEQVDAHSVEKLEADQASYKGEFTCT